MNRAVLAMLVCAVMAVPAHAQISASASLSVAMAHLGQGDWSGAEAAVANHSQIGRDIVIWHKLRAGQGQFGEYQDFLARRPDWPGLPLLVEAGESVIPADTEPVDVIAYFASTPPQTGTGALRLASAYVAIGASPSAADVIRTAWLTLPLNRTETGLFALRHADWLEDLHAARLDMLLWQGHLPQAVRMLARVDPATKDVAQTRLALLRRDRGVDDLMANFHQTSVTGPGWPRPGSNGACARASATARPSCCWPKARVPVGWGGRNTGPNRACALPGAPLTMATMNWPINSQPAMA